MGKLKNFVTRWIISDGVHPADQSRLDHSDKTAMELCLVETPDAPKLVCRFDDLTSEDRTALPVAL